MANPSTETAVSSAGGSNLLAPDVLMVVLTWGTFFTLFFILKKFAWKPILEALQKREDYIRKSLDDADKANAQLAQIEAQKIEVLNSAKAQANQIIDEARKIATTLAHDIEGKARQNAQDIIKSANDQIASERQHVRDSLKKESAAIAIALAGKILKENTDTDKNRRLVEEAIKQV